MDFVCHLLPGWAPLLRPAEPTRDWMDQTSEKFAYRCLPLNIANAHGWAFHMPHDVEVFWNGGPHERDIEIRTPEGANADFSPVSIFGHGVITFHIHGLFRTPPGWNLMVGGLPNSGKNGIVPLSGVIETDWSPYTFTMNWRFLQPNVWLSFRKDEPFCFIFPVQRRMLERFKPRFAEMDPDMLDQFLRWSESRTQFRAEIARIQPSVGSEQWQKRYYRGLDMDDYARIDDHMARLRLPEFAPLGTAPDASPDWLQLHGSAVEIGSVLRAVADLVAEGASSEEIELEVMRLGLSEPDAAAVVRAMRLGDLTTEK
jgi:hypothetical protein